ncbi:MAG: peptidyl-prolyl cis-trans isomerase [Gemmatimonadota bacterium]|nr:MAG: peptidyl-prolyl cis-trans isomerase [Gemmatimonadota bacterium]
MKPRSWLREPLLHFLLIGLALFGVSALWRSRDSGSEKLIAVTSLEIEWLRRNWEARWQRPPTETELRGLVNDFVRQEVLYREAIAMGLDRDDQVVRNRMVQKLELLTDDLAAQAQPAEAELQTYMQENMERYMIPERRSFTHVYFNVDRRGESVIETAEEVLQRLRANPAAARRAAELGDRFMLAPDYAMQSLSEVARGFGQRFADALFAVEAGEWQGPIASGYGWHLVLVTDVTESQVPELAQVRNAVLRDYLTSLREQASEALYNSLLQNYEVEIDEAAISAQSLGGNQVNGSR